LSDAQRAVGITTSVPVEVILAAGAVPVDLNNLFVASGRAPERVDLAERSGFPRNVCAWVKGLYGTVLEEGIGTVVGVTQGDCSLTHALLEVLETEGVEIVTFEFPYSRDEGALDAEIARFEKHFGVTRADTEAVRESLAPLRRDLAEVDRRMGAGLAPGFAAKAHELLLSGSDFGGGAPDAFAPEVKAFLRETEETEQPIKEDASAPRLALAGIPPIVSDLFENIEGLGARVVLDEISREFAMIRDADSIVSQYLAYTYPYDIFHRLKGLMGETAGRSVDGIVHYVQSFCFRGVHDRLLREKAGLPVLTLECDRPGELDGRTLTRLEAFMETLVESRATRTDRTTVG
jgi:benzoyl-CoA reductase/2-hydroxyglutaryl-CoA dehydratase subunit BcrC/BadD/HgdB